MSVISKTPIEKNIKLQDSFKTVVKSENYTTTGDSVIIVKDVKSCEILLNSKSTKSVKIKALSDTVIKSDYSIDIEYDEIFLNGGSSIELEFVEDGWYIMSSDGLRNT